MFVRMFLNKTMAWTWTSAPGGTFGLADLDKGKQAVSMGEVMRWS